MALDPKMVYTSHMINSSPTIVGEAGADLEAVRCKGVKFDDGGKIVIANTAGEVIIGVAILTNDANIAAGADVDIQIKDIGIAMAGGTVVAGAELAVDANGTFQTAAAGQYVAAIALESGVEGQIVRAKMAGYFKTA